MLLLASACGDTITDDTMPIESDAYETGIFITNEGPFGNGTGTLSFIDWTTDAIQNDVYSSVNEGQVLGNIVQSMSIHNDKVYFVVNNASKIEVADAGTLEYNNTIDGLAQPRYFLPINDDKAYVTEWGADGFTGAVNVVDLNSNTVSMKIPVGSGAEGIAKVGTQVYVANGGGFGQDSTLVVLDANTDEIIETLFVGDNPNSVVVDKDNAVWVLAGGFTDWNDPINNTNGALCSIVNNEITRSMIVPNGASDLVINPTGDVLYFSVNGTVVKHDISALNFDATPFIDQSFYGLGVDTDGNIWGADAKDFNSNGEVIKYDASGTELARYETGIIPNNFWFE